MMSSRLRFSDGARDEGGEQHGREPGDGDQADGAGHQGAHARVSARDQRRRVARQHDDEDQGWGRAHRVHRDEEGYLAVRGRTQDAAGDGVVHETADPGDQAAGEQRQVLPDQPALANLGQALAETPWCAGLHSPRHSIRRPWGVPARIIRQRCPNSRSPWSRHWS